MDVMELGAIGELVGGVAVIATLGYLAAQVRQSTRSSRSASYQAAISGVTDWTRFIGSNTDSAMLFYTGMFDPGKLKFEERIQWDFLFTAAVRTFENLHYQYEIGSLDETQWVGWAGRIRGIFTHPGAQTWWKEQKGAYSLGFQAFVDSQAGNSVPLFASGDREAQ